MWTNRINYLFLIAIIITGLLFYNHILFYILLAVAVLLPIISFGVFMYSAKKITVKVSVDKTLVGKNVPINVIFDVENPTVLSIENFTVVSRIYNYYYKNNDEYKTLIPVAPFCNRQTVMEVENRYCGRMIVEMKEVIAYDILGLFKVKRKVDYTAEASVFPYEVTELEELPVSTEGKADDDELQSKKGDDVSQISQIRNYIPGDKLQNIHWKLSAKSEELQVKEFSIPFSEEVNLLVEIFIDEEKPEEFDELIEKLYGVALYLIKVNRRFNVIWYQPGQEEFLINEVNNQDELLAAMMELFFAESVTVNGLAYDLYTKVYSESKGVLLYLSDGKALMNDENRIDIGSEKVVLLCLS